MTIKAKSIPDIIKELVEFRDNDYYWKDIPENKRRKLKHLPIADCTHNKVIGSNYKIIRLDDEMYPAHRVIHFLHTGEEPEVVDHIDGNKANNHYSNLRSFNRGMNRRNNVNQKHNSYGVSNHRKNGYFVRVKLNNVNQNVYGFHNKEDALFYSLAIRGLMFPGQYPVEIKINNLSEELKETLSKISFEQFVDQRGI